MRRLIPVLFLVACGGNPPPQPTPAAAAVEAATGPHLKIRVAVGQFAELEQTKALFDKLGWVGVAPLISEQAVTALVQTGRVTVLERSQIRKVIGNTQLESESDISGYFEQETTVEKGRLLGAQAVLVGSITEFEPNVSGFDGGIEVGWLGGLKHHQDKAVVGVDVRLVDQETGKVLAAGNGRGEINTVNAGVNVGYQNVKVGAGAWSKTPLGEATRAAAAQALVRLTRALQSIPWEGGIVRVDGDRVFVDAGQDVDLRPGTTLQVVHRGEAITGADGAVMGYDERLGGTVVIESVQPKLSIGRLQGGDPPQAGDRVRSQAPDA